MRDERRADRRRERKRSQKEFTSNPYKLAKKLFEEKKGEKLECSKEDLEKQLKDTYIDPKRNTKLPPIAGLKKPTAPGMKFNMRSSHS